LWGKAVIGGSRFLLDPLNINYGDDGMAKNEKTSKRVGKMASKLLRSKKTSKKTKSVAGSALTQRPDKKSGKKK